MKGISTGIIKRPRGRMETNMKSKKATIKEVIQAFNSVDDTNRTRMPRIVKQEMGWMQLINKREVNLNNIEDVKSLADRLCFKLSPEVLFADGERSRTEAMRLEKDIIKGVDYLSKISGIPFNPSELNPDY